MRTLTRVDRTRVATVHIGAGAEYVRVTVSHGLHNVHVDHVRPPNAIERRMGMTWEDKVERAIKRAEGIAARVNAAEVAAEAVAQRFPGYVR